MYLPIYFLLTHVQTKVKDMMKCLESDIKVS